MNGMNSRKQKSLLSYFPLKNGKRMDTVTEDVSPILERSDLLDNSVMSDSVTETNVISSSRDFESKRINDIKTESYHQKPSNSACDGLPKKLDKSNERTLHQRKSFFRISGQRNCKQILQREEKSLHQDQQLCKRIKLSKSPMKENETECGSFNCKSRYFLSRNILQEKSTNSSQSSVEEEIAVEKYSANDFVDIENLGDFLNEDWGEAFVEKCLNLNEWKTCRVIKVEETESASIVELKEYDETSDNSTSAMCYIQGYWGDERLKHNDVINIKAYYDDSSKIWRVDHTQGYIVKQPDILISGTCLVGSLFCQRRAVLGHLYPGLDSKNISMLIGSLIHELLQEVLSKKIYSERDIKSLAIKLINKPRSVLQSYEYDLASIDLEKQLLSIVPEIVNFVNIYILEKEGDKMWNGKIVDVLSTEENFWIPQLGFKGKADFILQTESEGKIRLMPLELKTGRASNAIEHRGQIILYLMMMAELGMESNSGLLLYLKHNILKEVNPFFTEKQGLITTRNNLVDYFAANEKYDSSVGRKFTPYLPVPINHHNGCARCPYLTICSAFLKEEPELKLEENNPLKTLSESVLSHLNSTHIHYVFHWVSLLRLEEMERKKNAAIKISDIWQMSCEDREKRNYCISKLIIVSIEQVGDKFIHHMQRLQNFSFDLTKSYLTENDYIIISTSSRIAVASGYVHSLLKNSICLKCDRLLDSTTNEFYTVDKYSVSETLLAFNISNLFALLSTTAKATRMRKLIIDMELPLFNPVRDINSKESDHILCSLNQCQKEAVLKTLAAEDYVLIKGLPGTGKTATIVALVRILVQLKYSVLITSHTHSAVDNILLRLKEYVDFLRLGSRQKVRSELLTYCEDFKIENENIHTVEHLELLYNQQAVIAVTCMGCSHKLLSKRVFDYCIVDEATQVLQPSILKCLFSARKFVLVGDPNQLPPVVQCRNASQLGLNESLFVKLDRAEVTSTLYLQYRMNSKIMELANLFAYNNELQCDNKDISSAVIKIIHRPKNDVNWLNPVLSSCLDDSIIFLNTSNLSSIKSSSEYVNEIEADITFKILDSLTQNVEDIGIIAPYREQVKLLNQMATTKQYHGIEINTVDQYQGRDKDVIIYSCTKHSDHKEGGILADKRRLTVAISRAKRKLIIIGNIFVLKKYDVFEELISLVPQHNLIDVLSM